MLLWRPEDNFENLFSLSTWGWRGLTQVIRFCWQAASPAEPSCCPLVLLHLFHSSELKLCSHSSPFKSLLDESSGERSTQQSPRGNWPTFSVVSLLYPLWSHSKGRDASDPVELYKVNSQVAARQALQHGISELLT